MIPKVISGGLHCDQRGSLFYNNDFDASVIKRIYLIENANVDVKRGWQGHKIEQRWFSVVNGSFRIKLIAIDNWNRPSKDLKPFVFIIEAVSLDILHIPSGYVSSIQSLERNSKLLVMSDYYLGEINDEYKFDKDYFK